MPSWGISNHQAYSFVVLQSGQRLVGRVMKIVFLLRSLNYGGAERQLVILAKGLLKRGHEIAVAVFYAGGPLERELREAGVRILPLHKRGRWDVLGFFLQLIRVMREEQPDILHSYLTDQNLVAVVLKPLLPKSRIVWGVRCSVMDLNQFDWLSGLSFRVTCRLARFADAVIINSWVGYEYHMALGYPIEKSVVIPNGIDTERFRPDPGARAMVRSEWGIAKDDKLIGLVGRLDPMKDHSIFLEAAALLLKQRTDVRFICVGGGPDDYRRQLQAHSKRLGLDGCLQWVGSREDMPAVYNALDIAVNCSYGEGLSNVIGEAMACGVACVVTNVGDSAWVVGDEGEVVPPKDPEALMSALERQLNRRTSGPAQIRQRILDQLSLSRLLTNTEETLVRLLTTSGAGHSPMLLPGGARTSRPSGPIHSGPSIVK
jgi:glycosyltransferase involved in cell wall biosynthesis